MNPPSRFPWKLFVVLLASGLLGVVAALPMMFELADRFVPPEDQDELEANLPLPIPLLVLLALVQNGAIFGGAIAAGLVLSRRIGTGAPLLAKLLVGDAQRAPLPALRPNLLLAAIVGLGLGTVLAVVDTALLLPHAPAGLCDFGQSVALWKRLLAGLFYGGITEELLMRLFLFSLVAWAFGRVSTKPDGYPTAGAFWLANVFVAVLFALGHLPATQALGPLTPVVVLRSLLLNGAASLVFGYLYWRRGLESAMVSHASAHLGLQIIGPLIFDLAG